MVGYNRVVYIDARVPADALKLVAIEYNFLCMYVCVLEGGGGGRARDEDEDGDEEEEEEEEGGVLAVLITKGGRHVAR